MSPTPTIGTVAAFAIPTPILTTPSRHSSLSTSPLSTSSRTRHRNPNPPSYLTLLESPPIRRSPHPFPRHPAATLRQPHPSAIHPHHPSSSYSASQLCLPSCKALPSSSPSPPLSSSQPAPSPLRHLIAAVITLIASLSQPTPAHAGRNPSTSATTTTTHTATCNPSQTPHRHHTNTPAIILTANTTTSTTTTISSSPPSILLPPSAAPLTLLSDAADSAAAILKTRLAFARRQLHTLRRNLRLVVQTATTAASTQPHTEAQADSSENHADESSHAAAVNDALVLLLTTVVIIPLTRRLGISPILGFLAAGIALGPKGFQLIRDVRTSKALAELGVVFFLFEMGLELSTSKLKSLGADVFGLGTTQFFITGALLSVVATVVGISSQAAIVIGAGLALSSSAFVLQLLSERGEVGTRFGRAAFGILLFQDLAVVPVLVLTPLLAGSGGLAAVVRAISIASAKAAVALTFIVIIGKNFLQPVFRFVARARSSEAFIAVILFTVLATSSLTQMLGLSDTLGAFLAGVMLAETRFRHQVEADIKPFRGLLLGLFFITVGFSIDLNLAFSRIGAVASMVTGLLFVKTSVIAVAAMAFGLSVGSALQTGLLLSQGGEFAFVIYGLAMREGVLATQMGELMLLVVALSMAMTPLLAALGRRISSSLERRRGLIGVRMEDADTADARDFVMVAGWGRVGQSVCEMLDAKLVRYMAFDTSPTRVIDARNKGLPVFFGDARRPEVLRSAGVERARAVVVTLDDPEQAMDAVQNIRREFEGVQVFCRARDSRHQKLLQAAGATAIVPELLEASLLLGGAVLLDYGTPMEEVNALIEEARAENVEELGLSDSVTATLRSSFKQMEKLREEEAALEDAAAATAAAAAAAAAEAAAATATATVTSSDGNVGNGAGDGIGYDGTEVDGVPSGAMAEALEMEMQSEGETFANSEDNFKEGRDAHVDTWREDGNLKVE